MVMIICAYKTLVQNPLTPIQLGYLRADVGILVTLIFRKRPWGPAVLTTLHRLPAKVGTNFADKRRSSGRHSSLAG
jgi:hypothetical protein